MVNKIDDDYGYIGNGEIQYVLDIYIQIILGYTLEELTI